MNANRENWAAINPLDQLGLSLASVRRTTALMIPKASRGRGGLPDYVIRAMYADYEAGQSTHQVGRLYGRSGQSIWETFHKHGLPMRPKEIGPQFIFRGERFAPSKGGVFRCTTGDRGWLHHRIWEAHHGKIPAGFQVSFKDGDPSNFSPSNLFCASPQAVTRHHYCRRFPNRADFTPEQRRAMWRTHNRLYMRRKAIREKLWRLTNGSKKDLGGNAAWRRLSDREPALKLIYGKASKTFRR